MPVVAAYPNAVAAFTEKFDFTDVVFAAHINALQAEVVALETILGTLPQGTAATVKARLLAIEAGLAQVAGRFDSGGRIPESGVTNLLADLAARSLVGHSHAEADVTHLLTDLSARSLIGHGHVEGDVASLVADLAGKASTSHTHAESQVTSLTTDLNNLSASITSVNAALGTETANRQALPTGTIASRNHSSTNNVGATSEALFTDTSGNIVVTATLTAGRKYKIVYWGMGVADAQGGTTDYNQASLDVRLRYRAGTLAPTNTSTILGWIRQAIGKGDSRIASSMGVILGRLSGMSTGQYTFGILGQTTIAGTTARILNFPAAAPAGTNSTIEVIDDGLA